MTFKPAHKPAGTPEGGQFTAPVRSDTVPSLPATSEDERNRTFWDRAQANAAERAERIRIHEADRLARLEARGVVEEEPEAYEYVPEAAPPVHTGIFRRAFSAIGSFSTFVGERHERDMAEIAALSRGGTILPKFLRRK